MFAVIVDTKMKSKNTYEVKVRSAEEIDPHYLTKLSREIKEQNPETIKVRGKVVKGDKEDNFWMISRNW